MRSIFAAMAFAVSAVLAASAQAGENVVVVELYTSQGCSSCPPADELLTKLADRDGVLALALHVDYWDYIGWKDIFGDPSFSARQKAYARATGQRTVYTPQMIIGGRDSIVGTKAMEVADALNSHSALPVNADLQLSRNGNRLSVAATWVSGKPAPKKMVLQLVQYMPEEKVRITRGENAGRTITYSNIVTHWQPIGNWDGRGCKTVTVDLGSSTAPLAVILQTDNYGPILAAAALR